MHTPQQGAAATQNGHGPGPASRADIEQRLTGEPLTTGYRPTLPQWAFWNPDVTPQLYLLRDIEMMMIHPVVINTLDYFKGGIAGAEFETVSESQEVAQFVESQVKRWWDRGVPKIQGGYEYGWIGNEALYSSDEGPLMWDGLVQFSPRDVWLLTQHGKPVGVRVKRVMPQNHDDVVQESNTGTGQVDLWMASTDVPAKGIWYAHNPRYNSFYGRSQLLGAWRPWRRLAWKDGAETVTDGGIYRFAYAGPLVKYPEEDYIASVGAPATTLDTQGRPRRYARDMARQLAEQYKTGAGIGVPSTKYPSELGGGDKWSFELPSSTLNVSGLLEYVKYLQDEIRYGIGVPPELMEAAETGSGYSGRAIPLEGFMMMQQRLADALLTLFVEQILRPLVRWNFGKVKWDVKVRPLLETKKKQGQQGQQGQPGGEAQQQAMPGKQPEQPGGGLPQAPSPPLANAGFAVQDLSQRILQGAAVGKLAKAILRRGRRQGAAA